MSNENSSGTRRFYGWTIVVSLWIIYFLNVGFPMYGGQTVKTFMADEMGFKRTILGLAFSLFNLFQGLPGPLIGYTIQKKGARFSIALGSILILVSAILMGYVVKSQWLFLLTFGVIAGVGVGFGTVVPVQTTVTQWFDRKRSRAMAITLTASGFGGFVAAPLLTMVLSGTGKWNNCWLVVAGAALVALLIDLILIKNKPADIGQIPDGSSDVTESMAKPGKKASKYIPYSTKDDWTVKEALTNSRCWLTLAAAIGLYIPYMMLISHGIACLGDHGIPASAAAFSISLVTATSIVGRLLGGELCNRMPARFVWAGSLVVLLMGSIFLMTATGTVGMVLYAVCTGIGFGASFVCMPVVFSSYYGAKIYSSLFGTLFPIITICSSISPTLAGYLFDASGSYTSGFIMIIAFNVVGIIASLLNTPPKKQ